MLYVGLDVHKESIRSPGFGQIMPELTIHWERRHLGGIFGLRVAGSVPTFPLSQKNLRCARRYDSMGMVLVSTLPDR